MSLNNRESDTLKGSKDEPDFTDRDFIVKDSTCNHDNTEDEVIFEKEVPGIPSANPLARSDCKNFQISEQVPNKEIGDDIEVICLSSQDSACASQNKPGDNLDEEEECQIIAVTSEQCSSSENFTEDSNLKGSEVAARTSSNGSANDRPAAETISEDKEHIATVGNEETAVPNDPVPETSKAQSGTNTEEENPSCNVDKASDELDDGEIELVMKSDLFCVDTKPEPSKEKKEKKLGPRFRREFNTTLKHEDKAENDEDLTKVDNRCFNCLGNHTLAECPNPKNQQEISKNRAAYLRNQPKLINRYHEEKEDRFGHFKAGVLSETLRRALGLRSDDIPMHIYRMRILGYPPGWVEEMKEYSSGIEFIDTPNSPDRGETFQTISFDFSRVIDYPGFNVPLSSRYRDEWQYLAMPPMQPYHSKENFIEQLKRHTHEHNNAPRPKRIRFNSDKAEQPPNLEIVDMETEDEDDAIEDTTIEDLEEKRMALLAQLQEQGSNSSSSEENGEIPVVSLDANDRADEKTDGPTTADAADIAKVDPMSPKSSKLLEVGTPVAIRHSSFSSLPDREKFAQGMGDLELYENLPNSTGTFQKMRSLLEKIRRTFKKS